MGKRGNLPASAKVPQLYQIREPSVDDSGVPLAAVGLDRHAQQLWDEVYPELIKVGFIKATDAHEMRTMCEWWSEYVKLRDHEDDMAKALASLAAAMMAIAEQSQGAQAYKLEDAAVVVKKVAGSYSGGAKQRIDMMSRAWANFHMLATKFGMTPADRMRMAGTKQPPKQLTAIEELMERRKSKLG